MSRSISLVIAFSVVALDAMLCASVLLEGAKARAMLLRFGNGVRASLTLLSGSRTIALLARLATAALFAIASYILLLMQSRYQFDHRMLVIVVFILSLVNVARPLAVAIISVLVLFALFPEVGLALKAFGSGSGSVG